MPLYHLFTQYNKLLFARTYICLYMYVSMHLCMYIYASDNHTYTQMTVLVDIWIASLSFQLWTLSLFYLILKK